VSYRKVSAIVSRGGTFPTFFALSVHLIESKLVEKIIFSLHVHRARARARVCVYSRHFPISLNSVKPCNMIRRVNILRKVCTWEPVHETRISAATWKFRCQTRGETDYTPVLTRSKQSRGSRRHKATITSRSREHPVSTRRCTITRVQRDKKGKKEKNTLVSSRSLACKPT